jgi:glycosyltransferase involved in cell wall biosynthesis
MAIAMKKTKVLMLGPSLYQQGGMASVENSILSHPFADVEIKHISTHEEGSVAHRGYIFLVACLQALVAMLCGEADVVHLHVSEKGSVARKTLLIIMARAFQKPVVLHAHGCEFHVFFDGLPTLGKKVIAWFFRQSSCVITLSESWKRYYTTNCHLRSDQVIVLHNPVELPDELPSRLQSHPTKLVFLGRIGKRKGAFDLIGAFAQLPAEFQQKATLTMAGDGEVEQAEAMAASLGISDRVRFLGWINPDQRNQLLAESDVFFLPSYNEGLPVAMLEAMSWGLPVVVTPVGGVTDIVTHGKNGLLINPGNVSQLSQAMQMLIEKEPVRLRMGMNARQRVAPLDVRYYCRVLLSIYRAATTNGGECRSGDLRPIATHRLPEEIKR